MNIDPTRRPALRYDPLAELRERWPDWRFECRALPDAGEAEAFLPDEKLIELDSGYFNSDWQLALAHAVAHLDLHLGTVVGVVQRPAVPGRRLLCDDPAGQGGGPAGVIVRVDRGR